MGNICFVDISNSGHHWFYNYNLIAGLSSESEIFFYGKLNIEQEKILKNRGIIFKSNVNEVIINNKVFKEIKSIVLLFDILKFCKKNKINKCIFLYLDEFLITLPIVKMMYNYFNIEIIGTLHWYPRVKFKKILLNYLNKSRMKIIVHTNYMRNMFKEKKEIYLVNYPVEPNIQNKNTVNKQNKEMFKLLYFGGTRYDKGLDILLESLKYIEDIDLQLNIAGKAEYFDECFINKKIHDSKNVNIIMDLDFISNEKMQKYFEDTDIVILPYRNIFSGESGVLAESINYGKPVILPNIIHFPEIIEKYNNGLCFEAENPIDLSNKIKDMINSYDKYKNNSYISSIKYKEDHSINKFQTSYKHILNRIN